MWCGEDGMNRRAVWVTVAVGLAALVALAIVDVARCEMGVVGWLLGAPGAVWVGLGLVGMVSLGVGEIGTNDVRRLRRWTQILENEGTKGHEDDLLA